MARLTDFHRQQWPTAAPGHHACVMARVQVVPAGFAARAPRERNRPGFRKGVNELSGKVLKTRVIY
jgi:hypothetical protein